MLAIVVLLACFLLRTRPFNTRPRCRGQESLTRIMGNLSTVALAEAPDSPHRQNNARRHSAVDSSRRGCRGPMVAMGPLPVPPMGYGPRQAPPE
jgi:hypothetical protein